MFNIPSKSNKQKHLEISFLLASGRSTDPDPDPLIRGTDPQQRFSHTAIVKPPTMRTGKTGFFESVPRQRSSLMTGKGPGTFIYLSHIL